jgi:hypothetical protein
VRWLRLYLRSRRIPVALSTAAATVAVVCALWLCYAEAHTVNVRLVSLTVMLAVVAFGPTLGGADDALEHTAAIAWPVRRGVHLLLTAAAVSTLALLTTVTDARFAPHSLVLRDTAGLLGLTALGAALRGAASAWIAPLTWTLITVLPLMQPSTKLPMQVAGWLIQPAGTTAASVCATVLATSGLLAYTLRGCPRHPATATAGDR